MVTQTSRLQLDHINKSFPGVNAVQDVSLSVLPGEVLALAGENGAGKTTLMNVLNGVIQADTGTISLDGQPVTIASPRHALDLGITMIHQELALIPELTVGQNIFLGREPRRGVRGLIDWKKLYADAQIEIDRLGLPLSARSKIVDLSIAQQQLVEIAKALSYRARLIVLDEPTSALTEREAETLFKLVRALRDSGVALIYISHRMEEIFALSDRVAVMRDGRLVGHLGIHERNSRCQRSELGYWVCRSVEGDGLCTRATRALLNEALSSGRLHKVILHADTGNAPSNRVATKLGFVREGTLIQQDWNPGRQEWRDLHVYGLLAAHWRSQ